MKPDLQTRLAILSEWQLGIPQQKLAERYGLSVSRINQICLDTKIKKNGANRKVHYLHPKLNHDACGLAGDSLTAQLTSNIEEVTCQHCLNTVAGKKRAGGREPVGTEAKVSVMVRIDKALRDKARTKKLNCSQLLEEAIKNN